MCIKSHLCRRNCLSKGRTIDHANLIPSKIVIGKKLDNLEDCEVFGTQISIMGHEQNKATPTHILPFNILGLFS